MRQQEKFMFLVVPIVDILLQTGWTVRYDVVTGLWLRQTKHAWWFVESIP
jgi:hypothetical protein